MKQLNAVEASCMKQLSPQRVLIVVSAAVFMASLDLFIVNIAFPDIQRDLGGSDTSLSWVLNAYAIVVAALLVPLGRLADLVGRKRAFVGGLVVFTLASALCAAAPSVSTLVAARVLQAAGAAALFPTSLALLLSAAPIAKRASYVATWAAAGAVAAAAGPPIGDLLVQASWRWVFLVNLPVGAIALVAALRTLREERDPDAAGVPDILGAVVLTGGVASLTAAIVEGPVWGWGGGRVIGLFSLAAALLMLFARRSASHPVPVVEADLLRVRSFAAANVAGLLFFAAFGAMLLEGVLFLTRVWHESVLTAGLMVSPGPLSAAVLAVATGRVSDRIGQRALAATGGLLFAAGGVWWIAQMKVSPNFALDYLPGMIIGGAGVGLVIPSLSSAAAAALPPARFATGSAIFGMSRQLGSALGVALLIAVIGNPGPADALDAFRQGWLLVVGGGVLASVAAVAMGRIGLPATVPAPVVEPA
jgi:EmrB/QacA subfamily drug resistance transporter